MLKHVGMISKSQGDGTFLILAGAMVYVCLHELLVESMEQLGVTKALVVLSSVCPCRKLVKIICRIEEIEAVGGV